MDTKAGRRYAVRKRTHKGTSPTKAIPVKKQVAKRKHMLPTLQEQMQYERKQQRGKHAPQGGKTRQKRENVLKIRAEKAIRLSKLCLKARKLWKTGLQASYQHGLEVTASATDRSGKRETWQRNCMAALNQPRHMGSITAMG